MGRYLKTNETNFRIVWLSQQRFGGRITSSPSLLFSCIYIWAYEVRRGKIPSHWIPWTIPFFARSWMRNGGRVEGFLAQGTSPWIKTFSTSKIISPIPGASPRALSSSPEASVGILREEGFNYRWVGNLKKYKAYMSVQRWTRLYV